MPQITFVQPDGQRRTVEAADAPTVMHAAVRNNVAGMPADCGGQLACGQCMVDVPADWAARLPVASLDEQDTIDDKLGRVAPEGRRLCCQIRVTPALDGLEVRVAEQPR